MDANTRNSVRTIAAELLDSLGAGEAAAAAFVARVTPLIRTAAEDLILAKGEEAHKEIVDDIFFAARVMDDLGPEPDDDSENSFGVMYGSVTGSPAASYRLYGGWHSMHFVDRATTTDKHMSDLQHDAVLAMERLARRRGFAVWRAPPLVQAREEVEYAHKIDPNPGRPDFGDSVSPADAAAAVRDALVTEVRFAGTEAGWFEREYCCAEGGYRGRWTPLSDSELEKRMCVEGADCCRRLGFIRDGREPWFADAGFLGEVTEHLKIMCLEKDPNRWAE